MNRAVSYTADLYYYMKRLYGAQYRLLNLSAPVKEIMENALKTDEPLSSTIEKLNKLLENSNRVKSDKKDEYFYMFSKWTSKNDALLFYLALLLLEKKDELRKRVEDELQELNEELTGLHPLSLKYDNLTVKDIYILRVVVGYKTEKYLLTEKNKKNRLGNLLKWAGKNNIVVAHAFFPIIYESLNQSITSMSGGGYEKRIADILSKIPGITDLERLTHEDIGSVEHDFIFKFEGKKFGVSAKRTLRERYKQYVNLVDKSDSDVFITITFGADLTQKKAETIRKLGVFIFVAPEVYAQDKWVRKTGGIYPADQLNKKTLQEIIRFRQA